MRELTDPETSGSKRRRWARPCLVLSWLLFLLAALLMAYGPAIAEVMLLFVIVFIRGFVGVDPSNPTQMMRQMIPVVLVVALSFGVDALPDRHREPAINWILLPVLLLFLGWVLLHEILSFRRAPRFFH